MTPISKMINNNIYKFQLFHFQAYEPEIVFNFQFCFFHL